MREHQVALNEFKYPEPDGLYLRMLKELVDVTSEELTEIFKKFWSTGKASENWRRVNIVPIFFFKGKS